jgi:hypothetical protein
MKKVSILLLLFFCFIANLQSNPVDTTVSKQIAINWFLHYNPSKITSYYGDF